jgi:hypothetical protein
MKKRLLFWLDKIIYGFEDTLPDKEYESECYATMQKEIKELKAIRKWVSLLP